MKDHCVIGPTAGSGKHARTWLENEDEAIAHATKLLHKTENGAYGQKCDKLFVVKIVAVVELTPPPTTVRKPKKGDTES